MILDKWYGDVVEAGRPRVLYRATLRLGPLSLGFSGEIDPARGNSSGYRVGALPLPRVEAGQVLWPTDSGPVRWSGAAPNPVPLWPGDAEALVWDPVAPNGAVSGAGIGLGSRGYAERLVMRIPPWRLGLKLLRWGRFCGGTRSLAWIEWVGDMPQRLALLDGKRAPLHRASLEGVEAGDIVLQFGRPTLFVDEPLASGFLQDFPWPRRIRPLAFLQGVERKWVASATLREGPAEDEGYTVFEEVSWP